MAHTIFYILKYYNITSGLHNSLVPNGVEYTV
jgi:hypothetical protein